MLLILTLLYFATRLTNLILLPIFNDEADHIFAAKLIGGNFWQYWDIPLTPPITKSPLYFYLLSFVLKIPAHFLWTGRLTSVIAGFFTFLGVYFVGKKFFSKQTALLASLLYIIFPFTLFYDRMALLDSLLSTFFVWIVYFLPNPISLGIFMGMALLTKQSGKLFFPAIFIILLINHIYPRIKKPLYLILPFLISLSMFYLLSASPHFSSFSSFEKEYYLNFNNSILNYLLIVKTNIFAIASWLKSYLTLPVFILFIFASLYALNHVHGRQLLLLILGPLITLCLVANSIFPRYFLFVIPLIALVIAHFLKTITHKAISAPFLFLLFLPLLNFSFKLFIHPENAPFHYNEHWQYISNWPSGYGLKPLIKTIKNHPNYPKLTLFTDGLTGMPTTALQLGFTNEPTIKIIPMKRWLGGKQISAITSQLKSDTAVLVITNRKQTESVLTPPFQLLNRFNKPGNEFAFFLYQFSFTTITSKFPS